LEDKRFAALKDSRTQGLKDSGRSILEKTETKSVWLQWYFKRALYTGARRSETARLRGTYFQLCSETERYYIISYEGKSKATKRSVAIHQLLVNDGLLQYIGKNSKELLFTLALRNLSRVTDLFVSMIDLKVNEMRTYHYTLSFC